MPTLVASGQLTVIDQKDLTVAYAVFTPEQELQQTYDEAGSPQYSPDRTTGAGGVMTVDVDVYLPAAGGPTNITADLQSIHWGTTPGGSQLDGNLTNSNGVTTPATAKFEIKTNAFVTYLAPTKTVYFSATYVEPVTSTTQTVNGSFTVSVVIQGTNATFAVINGDRVINVSIDPDEPNYVCLFGSLFKGSAEDTTNVRYKWFIGPSYGVADQLDVNHALVTGGDVVFKSEASIAAGNYTDASGLITAPTDGGWANGSSETPRGIIIYDSGVTSKLQIKCVIEDDVAGPTYDAYETVTDKTDPIIVVIAGGNTIKNGVGSLRLWPRVLKQGTESNTLVQNMNRWQFDYYYQNSDGTRGAFVDGENKTITSHTTGAGAVFTLSGTFTTPPVADDVIKITKNGEERYYEVASATNVTNATVTIKSTATVHTWINSTDWPNPTANEFDGGRLDECVDQYTQGPMTLSGSPWTLNSTNCWDGTDTFTTTSSTAALTAGDIIRVWLPGDANSVRYYEVASVATNDVTVKLNAYTYNWLNKAGGYGRLPATQSYYDSGTLQKVTGDIGITIDGADINLQGMVTVDASRV